MIADHAVLATWREDDQFDPVALIKRGLQLARQLELHPSQPLRRKAVQTKAVRASVVAGGIRQPCAQRLGVTTQLQSSVAPLSMQQTSSVADRFARDWAKLWWQRGQHKLQQRDFVKAQENFSKALLKWPQMAAAHNGLGIVFYHCGDLDSAIAAYQQALYYEPQAGHIRTNLASAYYCLGDIVSAIATYRQALYDTPTQVLAYYGLGVALFRLSRYSEALTAYEQAIQLQPNHAHSYAAFGRLLFELGDRDGAIAAYRKAMQLNPDYASVYVSLQLNTL